MLTPETILTEKTNSRLVIQVSLSGLSYCCFNTLNDTISSFNDIIFDLSNPEIKIESHFAAAFEEYPQLTKQYDEIQVVHSNSLTTLVPASLFDEQHLASYMQYNTKVFDSDFFSYDAITAYQMNLVYIPYVNINNFLIDKYGSFDYKHSNSVLVNKLLQDSKNDEVKKMYVHFDQKHFEIAVIQKEELLLFNSFEYKTVEDFIYYILFTAEQLSLNPEHFPIVLLGDITSDSEFYKIAYKYIRNVSLLDVEDLRWNNYFSEAENRKHYILFNS